MNVKELIEQLQDYDEDLEIVLLTKPWRGLGATYDLDGISMEVGISTGRGQMKDEGDVCCDYQKWACPPCGNVSWVVDADKGEVCGECGTHIDEYIPKEGSCKFPSHNTEVLAFILEV